MMKRAAALLITMVMVLSGCATPKKTDASGTSRGIKPEQVGEGIAAGIMFAPLLPIMVPAMIMEHNEVVSWKKKFAKLEVGMAKEEVQKVLGNPRKCAPEASGAETCGYGEQQTMATDPDKYWVKVSFVDGRSVTFVCSGPCGEIVEKQ